MIRRFIWVFPLILALLGIMVWFPFNKAGGPKNDDELSLNTLLGGEGDRGFARAIDPRSFRFPADHGPHPEFQTEWWYFTGNLFSESGRRFGYQLTIFRFALSQEIQERTSEWAAQNIYMGHFALTDLEEMNFYHFERFAREALGLAGAESLPMEVWLEDWSILSLDPSGFPMRLRAETEDIAIDFFVETSKPVVLQGEEGLSQKSAEPGNASYYYSFTRMPTKGVIRIHDQKIKVSGFSWLDREWSTSVLGQDQVGWDWFSLQLDNDHELMYYQLRKNNGTADPLSSGVIVGPEGRYWPINSTDIQIQVLDHWDSPETQATYPNRWRIIHSGEGLDLEVIPIMPNQEMETSVRYWEGAVDIKGDFAGRKVEGFGYVELTGY